MDVSSNKSQDLRPRTTMRLFNFAAPHREIRGNVCGQRKKAMTDLLDYIRHFTTMDWIATISICYHTALHEKRVI